MPRLMTQTERVEYMLSALDLSAAKFAKACGLTEATVSRWRSGQCNISQERAHQIEDTFPQFSTPWIMGETSFMNEDKKNAALGCHEEDGGGRTSMLDGANYWANEVSRAKWLHIVTARHLRKARRTIRELREEVGRLKSVCDEKNAVICGYRGQIGRDNPFGHIPEHYSGDGYISCDRAIESASAQPCIVDRTPLQFWYWATAMKYVWRMWSKEDPEKDAMKAIDCLEKAAGLGRLFQAKERKDG